MKSTYRKPIAIFFAYLSILGFGVTSIAGEQEPADAWEFVRNFEGDWTGTADGQFGKSTVDRTYTFVLDAAYLHEKDLSTYPPQDRNPDGEVHEHWSFFSHDHARQVLVLRQFHDERIVNQSGQTRLGWQTLATTRCWCRIYSEEKAGRTHTGRNMTGISHIRMVPRSQGKPTQVPTSSSIQQCT